MPIILYYRIIGCILSNARNKRLMHTYNAYVRLKYGSSDAVLCQATTFHVDIHPIQEMDYGVNKFNQIAVSSDWGLNVQFVTEPPLDRARAPGRRTQLFRPSLSLT